MSEAAAAPGAVIFDLGGTLVDWPGGYIGGPEQWGRSWDSLITKLEPAKWPSRVDYISAMQAAEAAHWQRVIAEQWSGSAAELLTDGFRRLGCRVGPGEIAAALDGYAQAINGWATVQPGARDTLRLLRRRGYALGLLSNTWWASDWHNADLAAHGLAGYLDALVYTSDLPHSKPHPSAFLTVAASLAVEPRACVMVGDRLVDDIAGGLGVGMRAVWMEHQKPWPFPTDTSPSATIRDLREIPALLRSWGGA